MTVYTETDLERIAAAINVTCGEIKKSEKHLEAAALWYRMGQRRPKRIPPSKLREKLRSLGKHATALLKTLKTDLDHSADGPGDIEILEALVLDGDVNEDPVIEATCRIGRLVEILDGIEAAAEFNRRATQGVEEISHLGKLTVKRGNAGDEVINDWIAAMMGLYKSLTGKEPSASVGSSGRPDEGTATGPLIRFVQAAGAPLDIQYDEDALRSRIRTIKKATRLRN